MAARGHAGGLASTSTAAAAVLDAAGFDLILLETVGTGQAEVEVAAAADTTVVLEAPEMGDEVQAIKAGLLEVADVHVVNKADRPDAHKTASELVGMLMLHPPNSEAWAVPVLSTVALDGTGVADLIDTIDAHRIWLRDSGELAQRERAAAAARIRAIAKDLLLERIGDPAAGPLFDELVESVATRRVDPESAAALLLTNAAQADLYLEKTT
jgi:LAO/AO transport system kinase